MDKSVNTNGESNGIIPGACVHIYVCVCVCVVLWLYSVRSDAEWNRWQPASKNSPDWQSIPARHAHHGGRWLRWVKISCVRDIVLASGHWLQQPPPTRMQDWQSTKNRIESFALHINDKKCCRGVRSESPKYVKTRLRLGLLPSPLGYLQLSPISHSRIFFLGGEEVSGGKGCQQCPQNKFLSTPMVTVRNKY